MRVVDDGREEVGGLDEREVSPDPVNARVVRGVGADQEVGIRRLRELAQDLRQELLAQLGGSTGAGGQGRQLDGVVRHMFHLLSAGAS